MRASGVEGAYRTRHVVVRRNGAFYGTVSFFSFLSVVCIICFFVLYIIRVVSRT
jgi:hypothetical protein